MTRKTLILIILIFMLIISVKGVVGAWPNGWWCGSTGDNTNCLKDNTIKYFNSNSLKITNKWVNNDYTQSSYYASSQLFSTTSPKYIISVYAKGIAGENAYFNIIFRGKNNQDSSSMLFYPTENWQKFSFEATAKDTQSFIILHVPDAANNGKTVYFDNLQVVQAGDLGFIDSTKKYFCNYENLAQSTAPSWKWLDSVSDYFKIHYVVNDDLISNSENWYVCNATGNALANGISISEYGTFTSPLEPGEGFCPTPSCQIDPNTQKPINGPCCVESTYPIGNYQHCNCYDANNNPIDECAENPNLCTNTNPDSLITEETILKELCLGEDIINCMDFTLGDNTKTCSQQDGEICGQTELCIGGSFIEHSGTGNCCYNGYCSSGNSELTCEEQNGAVCDETQYCAFGDYIPSSDTEFCCSSGLCLFNTGGLELAQINSSFICNKNNGNNLLSECCYNGKCYNLDYYAPDSKIFGTGAMTGLIKSFDEVTTGKIVDYIRRYKGLSSSFTMSISKNDFANYNYIELDIAYNKLIGNISIIDFSGNEKSWEVIKYLTNGNESFVWHHLKVPLTDLGNVNLKNIQKIKFYLGGQTKVDLLLDNLFLSTTKNLGNSYNSKTEYCTGIFGKWINDLDPNAATTDFQDINSYGPYKFACDSQLSFGWTGTQCCGDDTLPSVLGSNQENYNDTISGCWNGNLIKNDKVVAKTLRIEEFKDVLYYGREFIGCINNHPEIINSQLEGDLIASTADYCSIKGSYYCSHNEGNSWEKEVPGYMNVTQMNGETLNTNEIPPGVNLLKNGGFDN